MLQAAYNNESESAAVVPTVNQGSITDTDQCLLEAIANGNQTAMESFYHQYGDQVFQFAHKTLKNPDDAAEVLNEVMLQVWKKPTAFQGRSKVSTWLLSITHHKAVDLVRKKSRHDNNDSVDLDIIAAEQNHVLTTMSCEQSDNYIRQQINALPAIYREVIYLSFYQELHYTQVAEILSIPVGTVKTRVMNAKKQLKKSLTQ
ncbi:RNA polymerase sigma factor [Oceanicoccus sagamiensis]|uniref:RNA polymerase subunit sigma n=1 Tax=Oceanicoccus sagamiensis TaxID=716816 RepID=A0A1X9NHZ2_9GAMM|nr:sigma-70 family RNA polymerase sigma factor [Oceanicoccus sagamiensis]ARN75129.1 hypothetical protein BST96_13995 [Oceanicoccus sagamiensis]